MYAKDAMWLARGSSRSLADAADYAVYASTYPIIPIGDLTESYVCNDTDLFRLTLMGVKTECTI